MTYYEEFGIPSSATPDEIRHAHRQLVKILHPDLHMEEKNRQLAEIQTRRINGIAQTLLDTERRDLYDISLLLPMGHVKASHAQTQWPYSHIATAAVTVALVLGGRWMTQGPAVSRSHEVQQAPPGATPIEVGESHAFRKTVNTPTAERNNRPATERTQERDTTVAAQTSPGSPLHVDKLDVKPTRAVDPPHAETTITSQSRSAALPEANPPAAQPASPTKQKESPLIGTWIYVPAPVTDDDSNIYRPEYIEMRVRNIQGVIEGQYRARYHVPDRPLSPNVGFRFAGQAGSESTSFRWSGSNGLAGKVVLKLMTSNSIQVDWKVTDLVATADLVSGTAILTRVQ